MVFNFARPKPLHFQESDDSIDSQIFALAERENRNSTWAERAALPKHLGGIDIHNFNNLGYTCFLSSLITLLRSIPDFFPEDPIIGGFPITHYISEAVRNNHGSYYMEALQDSLRPVKEKKKDKKNDPQNKKEETNRLLRELFSSLSNDIKKLPNYIRGLQSSDNHNFSPDQLSILNSHKLVPLPPVQAEPQQAQAQPIAEEQPVVLIPIPLTHRVIPLSNIKPNDYSKFISLKNSNLCLPDNDINIYMNDNNNTNRTTTLLKKNDNTVVLYTHDNNKIFPPIQNGDDDPIFPIHGIDDIARQNWEKLKKSNTAIMTDNICNAIHDKMNMFIFNKSHLESHVHHFSLFLVPKQNNKPSLYILQAAIAFNEVNQADTPLAKFKPDRDWWIVHADGTMIHKDRLNPDDPPPIPASTVADKYIILKSTTPICEFVKMTHNGNINNFADNTNQFIMIFNSIVKPGAKSQQFVTVSNFETLRSVNHCRISPKSDFAHKRDYIRQLNLADQFFYSLPCVRTLRARLRKEQPLAECPITKLPKFNNEGIPLLRNDKAGTLLQNKGSLGMQKVQSLLTHVANEAKLLYLLRTSKSNSERSSIIASQLPDSKLIIHPSNRQSIPLYSNAEFATYLQIKLGAPMDCSSKWKKRCFEEKISDHNIKYDPIPKMPGVQTCYTKIHHQITTTFKTHIGNALGISSKQEFDIGKAEDSKDYRTDLAIPLNDTTIHLDVTVINSAAKSYKNNANRANSVKNPNGVQIDYYSNKTLFDFKEEFSPWSELSYRESVKMKHYGKRFKEMNEGNVKPKFVLFPIAVNYHGIFGIMVDDMVAELNNDSRLKSDHLKLNVITLKGHLLKTLYRNIYELRHAL